MHLAAMSPAKDLTTALLFSDWEWVGKRGFYERGSLKKGKIKNHGRGF